MKLAPGDRLGPYEILAPLGAGGMGEVYRARDTRLGRDVAVKVLPEHLSADPEIRARFEREAKTVSSLSHPHICTLFDVGREGDVEYLVMELVEGETLAVRLQRGPLAIPELLRLAIEIAGALDRAHRAGVIHRDLKPGNIMVTRGGAKLMDFGLSRVTGLAPAGGSGTRLGALTQSPTIAQPLTAEGTLLGTFQYMAPEQLEGREADVRGDIWALGCVLYEMATGRRAFTGRSQASLIAAILERDPPALADVAAPMAAAPPGLEWLIRHCLAKDPDERLQTAHDVKLQLQRIADGADPVPIVSRENPQKMVGFLNRSSILSAWTRQIEEENVRE
ncbi:MAG TPA: serine/threonine-protein kinase, partial [Candidatus Eisenbacteria bacterium]|nr:serine/threonine-protein kinase [Candidatus Eisenbacteria bacterium]